jgi:ribonuclease P protein component
LRRTLKKSEILRGKRNFESIFERGKRIRSEYIQGIVLDLPGRTPDGPGILIAAVVPKAAGNAAWRNRVRRLIREAYRNNKDIIGPPGERPDRTLNVVFLWSPRTKPSSGAVSFPLVREEITGLLQRIREQFT